MDQRTQSPSLCLVRWLKNYVIIIMKTINVFPYSIVVAIGISVVVCLIMHKTVDIKILFIFLLLLLYTPVYRMCA